MHCADVWVCALPIIISRKSELHYPMASAIVCSGPKILVLEFCTITTGRIDCRFDTYDLIRHQLKGGVFFGFGIVLSLETYLGSCF